VTLGLAVLAGCLAERLHMWILGAIGVLIVVWIFGQFTGGKPG